MKRTLLLVFVLFSLLFATAYGSFADNFDDNSTYSPLWLPVSSGGPSVSEVNHRLEITIPATSVGGTFYAGYDPFSRIRGDFDVRVDYQLLTWPAGNEVRLGMMMFGDTIGYANMVRCSSTEELYIADFYGAPLPSPRVTTTDMSGKLRLTRQGTTIIGYYYQSGAWVSLYSKVVTNADLGVSLRAWSHDTIFPDKEAKVAFDNFQILQGSLVPAVPAIPEPSSLLALASGLMALGLVRRRLSSK